jgi:hypothetical protein
METTFFCHACSDCNLLAERQFEDFEEQKENLFDESIIKEMDNES